jgi:hypothetical protein
VRLRPVGVVGVAGTALVLAASAFSLGSTNRPSGWVEVVPPIVASFARASYSPGQIATLKVYTRAHAVILTIGRADSLPSSDNHIVGKEVLGPIAVPPDGRIRVRIQDWPSGLYFARLESPAGLLGFAPFVLRPRVRGTNRIAVVLPTNTWDAYNFRDSDHDGVGDTWYASPEVHRVDTTRPFLNNGVPPHFRQLDAGFLTWFDRGSRVADFFADVDLESGVSGARLARLYDLIVFPGHTEYVTQQEYDVVTQYRDLGGNLLFLSANNFFRHVRRNGRWLVRLERWRDASRAEAALVGVQYVTWFQRRFRNRPLEVVGAHRAPWLFAGTGLHNGSKFGVYGIEVDARAPESPPGTQLLAGIPDIFGPGRSAEMTYYRTSRGAKVFAAGVMNFGGTAAFPTPGRMLDNLWAELSRP